MHRVPNVLPEFKFISANTTVPSTEWEMKQVAFQNLGDLFSPYYKSMASKPKAGNESKWKVMYNKTSDNTFTFNSNLY